MYYPYLGKSICLIGGLSQNGRKTRLVKDIHRLQIGPSSSWTHEMKLVHGVCWPIVVSNLKHIFVLGGFNKSDKESTLFQIINVERKSCTEGTYILKLFRDG